MRLRPHRLLLPLSLSLALGTLSGCAAGTSFVKSDATLGRVVVYRNGIAYYERFAHVEGSELKLTVPPDKVDDFLKSLSVVDAKTGKPVGVSYPTGGNERGADGQVQMKIQIPGAGPHDVRISYVTESPSWKPSYRVTLGKDGKLKLQGWAIVDNTSGEDWKNVKLGVGSSSALSFRFDLQSVRRVERETLRADDLFALAPPGGTVVAGQGGQNLLTELSDAALAQNLEIAKRAEVEAKSHPGKKVPAAPAADPLASLARQIQAGRQSVVIEGYAAKGDADKRGASLERANKMREQLIRNGVAPDLVVAVGAGEVEGRSGVRVVEAQKPPADAKPPSGADLAPIDSSQFESSVAMTVGRGKSAMVSIVDQQTDGDVVYLYDAESPRGNATFAFKSIRVKNPTDSALETGPVTVFGEAGGFVGEGLADAIPPKSVAFVPFALDRQVAVERKDGERDEIAKILTVQRGVFSTEVKHLRKTTYVLQNRLAASAVVYVRHTVPKGYSLVRLPEGIERLGQAHLFRVELAAGEKREVLVEESTPVLKTTDIRSAAGMELIKAYVSAAARKGPLEDKMAEVIRLQTEMANLEQRIATAREQMAEYRARMDELHAQIVTLKLVKTAGPLMKSLEQKLQETSDKVSKQTVDVVTLQEQHMVAKIKLQDRIADLTLEEEKPAKKPELKPEPKADPKALPARGA